MDKLIVEATRSSPAIQLDAEARQLHIRGESYPENAAAFYAPVFAWLKEFIASLESAATVYVDLEILYLNSSSTKIMLNLLDVLDGANIIVNWRYDPENEAMLECGQDFSEELKALTFNLVEQKS